MRKVALFMCAALAATCVMSADVSFAQDLQADAKYDVVKGAGGYNLQVTSGADISQALMDALKAGNDTIVIPAGNYTMSQQVGFQQNNNNVTIKAEGATIKATGNTETIMFATAQYSHSNITIQGGTWDGNNKVTSAVFRMCKTSGFTLKDCTVKGSKKAGVLFQGCENINISNTTMTENGEYGLNLDQASKANVKNCTVSANKDCGILVQDNSALTTSGITVTQNKGHGISVQKKASLTIDKSVGDVKITENDWNGISIIDNGTKASITGGVYNSNGRNPKKSSEGESGHGIGIFKQSEAVIDGVVCNNNKVCGISPFNPGTKVTLTNSEINGNGSHGVGGRNGITISISNCNFSGNKDNGIMANDKSSLTMVGSSVSGSGQHGISIGKNSKGILENVVVAGSKNEGIYVYESSKATIKGGESSSNVKNGITTNNKADVKISGVTVKNNKNYGMNIKGGKADIQKCVVEKNKKSGIQIKKSDAGKKEASAVKNLSGNTIKSNGQYGIYVNSSKVDSMQKNTISDHKKTGIALYGKSTAKNIKKNKLSNVKGREVYVESGSKSNIATTAVVKINKVKKNAKQVSGTAGKKVSITVVASGKTYAGKSNAKGKFSIKTSKLSKGTEIVVTAKDKGNNTFTNSIVVK